MAEYIGKSREKRVTRCRPGQFVTRIAVIAIRSDPLNVDLPFALGKDILRG